MRGFPLPVGEGSNMHSKTYGCYMYIIKIKGNTCFYFREYISIYKKV